MSKRIYLDWNATAPIRDSVRSAITNALDVVGNPSSVHLEGRAAQAIVEKSRTQVASLCGVEPDRVIFTSGATEAAALVLAEKDLLSAPIEHPAILAWTHPNLTVNYHGDVQITNPNLSTLQLANSETGRLQTIPKGLKVTDATQALGKIAIKEEINQADYAIVSAHKLGGPKGIGAVVLGTKMDLEAQLKGGGQEFNRRSGTENIYGIAGFGAAAVEAEQELQLGKWKEIETLRNKCEEMLKDAAKNIIIFSEDAVRLPNTSCFAVPGWKGFTQMMLMDLNGIAVSTGSACSSGRVRSGHTLRAFGINSKLAESAIRVSIGPSTTLDDITQFVQIWHKELKQATIRQQCSTN